MHATAIERRIDRSVIDPQRRVAAIALRSTRIRA
jgi:hypothetical protein